MTHRKALLVVGLASTAIFASMALGGAPMGPPMALLGEGNWGVGAEYGHDNMDLRASGTLRLINADQVLDFVEDVKITDLAMNMFFATVGYGVCDNWDIFVRLGASDAKDQAAAIANIPPDPDNPNFLVDSLGVPQRYSLEGIDSDFGFAWGVGTRATFCRSGPWAFGGLVQATFFKPGDADIRYMDPLWARQGVDHVGKAKLDFWEAQVSLAASYQVDTLRLWAGPFLQFVSGDFDRSGEILFDGVQLVGGSSFRGSSDLQQESEIGGHFGGDWSISQQVDLWVEGQVTGDSWFVGVGLLLKPQQSFGM
jgi:hypothetical protein